MSQHGLQVELPRAVLAGCLATLSLTLPPATQSGNQWPSGGVVASVYGDGGELLGNATFDRLYSSGNATLDGLALSPQMLQFIAPSVPGYSDITVELRNLTPVGDLLWSTPALRLWAIPPWLSVLPVVATLVLAIVLQQVLVALVIGVWLGATAAYGNPASASGAKPMGPGDRPRSRLLQDRARPRLRALVCFADTQALTRSLARSVSSTAICAAQWAPARTHRPTRGLMIHD